MLNNYVEINSIEFERSVSISILLVENIKNQVIEKLGLTNKRYLNDKLDGIYYYTKIAKSILSVYVIEKILGIELIEKKSILKTKNSFNINNTKITIIGVTLDEDIIISNAEADLYVIVGLYDNFRKGKILGSLSKQTFDNRFADKNKSLYTMSKPSIIIERSLLNNFKDDLSK